jgi:hypothetical protein
MPVRVLILTTAILTVAFVAIAAARELYDAAHQGSGLP